MTEPTPRKTTRRRRKTLPKIETLPNVEAVTDEVIITDPEPTLPDPKPVEEEAAPEVTVESASPTVCKPKVSTLPTIRPRRAAADSPPKGIRVRN